MIARLLYTALLVGLSVIMLRELWTVWFDDRLFVGRFAVMAPTGKDEEAGTSFSKRIVGAQAMLAQQLVDYRTRRSDGSPSDVTFVIPGMKPVDLPPSALAGFDLTVQSVNLGQALTTLRKSIVYPNELTGTVTSHDGAVLAAVSWPGAPRIGQEEAALRSFLVPPQMSEQGVAAHIAATLFWARAASEKEELAVYSRAQFCDFGMALGDLYALAATASTAAGLAAKDIGLVRQRAAQLRSHYGEPHVYPDLYRVRADLLDLLPEKERRLPELIEAQEDRLAYAMLSPKLQELSGDDRRYAALALARPAIAATAVGFVYPANWSALLRPRDAEIKSLAQSVGLILDGNGRPVGTGVIVAPRLLLAARFSLASGQRVARKTNTLTLCMGRSGQCESKMALGDVVYDGHRDQSRVALIDLPDHDPSQYPPAQVADALPPANSLIGQYAFVIGYAFRDSRMPVQWLDRLIGKDDGVKRLMPGRVLAFGAPPRGIGFEGTTQPIDTITSDISTLGGTAGSPLADLSTGKVIGMSFAGQWKDDRGKFSYSEVIPTAALDIIAGKAGREVPQPKKPSPNGR